MNQADVDILVHNAPLPPGYELVVTPQRSYRHRSLWSVRILDADGNRLWARAYYNPAQGIVEAQKWAWSTPLTVTTDADGYITSMTETD